MIPSFASVREIPCLAAFYSFKSLEKISRFCNDTLFQLGLLNKSFYNCFQGFSVICFGILNFEGKYCFWSFLISFKKEVDGMNYIRHRGSKQILRRSFSWFFFLEKLHAVILRFLVEVPLFFSIGRVSWEMINLNSTE